MSGQIPGDKTSYSKATAEDDDEAVEWGVHQSHGLHGGCCQLGETVDLLTKTNLLFNQTTNTVA